MSSVRPSVCTDSVSCRLCEPRAEEEATGSRRKLPTEEFHTLYSSRNVIRTIKSRMIKYVKQVAGDRHSFKIVVGKLETKDHLEDPAVDGNSIFQRILKYRADICRHNWICFAQDWAIGGLL